MHCLQILVLLFIPSLKFTKADDWDYIIFSQSWPKTTCRVWIDENSTEICAYSQVHNSWNVHGIWPTLSGTRMPEFCNLTWSYDAEVIKPLEFELERSWTNIVKDSPKHALWAHEWDKHGTCSTNVKTLNTQMKYFSRALQWYAEYNITNLLSEANIVPSTQIYNTTHVYNAVKHKLGVKPEITCARVEGIQYLSEIRLCFSEDLDIIDCKHKEYFLNDLEMITNCDETSILYI